MADDRKDVFQDMLMGIAIFVGGMITILILLKLLGYFDPPQQLVLAPVQEQKTQPILRDVDTSVPVKIMSSSPVGEFFTRSLVVTDVVTLMDETTNDGLPWTSFDFTNNGPNPVYLSVNNTDMFQSSLPVGQTINVDMRQQGVIKRVYLRCDIGETANVRFYIVK